ncbi:hypothetical protein L345_03129 [Ophiophagus hannah]|uniref:Ig-like domain-containing protein n=1 Tax=Ophiophagus hannah TaxID=8665 RepID=V8P9R0_OPHHA|nr:hypothetical protein L345_03129 [Ophiophagus hannah]
MVTVTSESPKAPSLFPLLPSGDNSGTTDISIGCMAKDFLPDSIEFSWDNPQNQSIGNQNYMKFPSVLLSGMYTATSQAKVPRTTWEQYKPFYCKATHPQGNKIVQVVQQPIEPLRKPTMLIRAPILKTFSSSYLNSTVTCEVSDVCSGNVVIRWRKEQQEITTGITTSKPIPNGHGGYTIWSKVVITKEDWISEKKFTCEAKGNGVNLSETFDLLSFCKGGPSPCLEVAVETIPPAFADMFLTNSANLTCKIFNIPADADYSKLNVTWTRASDQKQLPTVMTNFLDQGNDFYYVNAVATVCATEWKESETFTCKVTFDGILANPVEKPLKKDSVGEPKAPSVYVLPPSLEELNLRETVTITCLVKNFNPSSFFVQWLQNDQPVSELAYFTSKAILESKIPSKEYFAYSMLNVNEQEWSAGDSFTCVVGHEALPYNLTQKTINKNTDKFFSVSFKSPKMATMPEKAKELLLLLKEEQKKEKELMPRAKVRIGDMVIHALNALYLHMLSKGYVDGIVDSEDEEEFQNLSSILSTFIILFLVSLFYSATVTVIKSIILLKNIILLRSRETTRLPDPNFHAGVERTTKMARFYDEWFFQQRAMFFYFVFSDCILQPLKSVDVQILTPSCGTQSSVVNVELVCFLRSLSSGKAKVEWLKNGVQLQEKEEVALRPIVGKGSGYSSFIHLNISKESWDKGDLYTCKVTRLPGSQNVTMHNASKCQVCYGCMHQPTMSFTKPSYKSLLDRSAILVCTVISSNLENAQITWLVNGKPSSDVVHERVTTDANGSQKLRSNHSVSLEQWTKGTIFTCKVTGSCFEEHRKEITIEKATQMKPPSVIISRAPLEISLESTTALILICDVSGFSPADISISWERNNVPLNKKLYDNGVATQMANGYSVYSILKISRDEPGGKGGSYCCIVHHPTSQSPYSACEKVPIDFLEPRAPTVELLQSVDGEKGMVMLKCIATDYRPPSVTIKWVGDPQNKKEDVVEQRMADGTYWASSQFTTTLSQWQEMDSKTCEVVHQPTSTTKIQKISRKDWVMPTTLMVTLNVHPLCPNLGTISSVTLVCSIYSYSLENIQVTWKPDGNFETSPKDQSKFYASSNFTVSLQEWNKLKEYTCKVTQAGRNHTETRTISKCKACKNSMPPPTVYLLKPPLERLFTQNRAILSCLVVGYELENIMFTWTMDGLNLTMNATTEKIKTHTNRTQSFQSQLNLTRQIWDAGKKIECIVSHLCSLFAEVKQSIQKSTDSSQEPSLSLVLPPLSQLTQATSQAVAWLACVINGFFPSEILIKWKKNNRSIDASEYVTGPSILETGKSTFSTQSILKIPASEWENRAVYTCLVGHESLTIMKNISKYLYDFLKPTPPRVMAFHIFEDKGYPKLVCLATSFYPKIIDIQWNSKGEKLSSIPNCSSPVPLPDGTFQKDCSLTIRMVTSPSNMEVIKMQLPSFEELFTNRSATLTCMMSLTNASANATFSWTMDGKPANNNSVTNEVFQETNYTSLMYGRLQVNLSEWINTTQFTWTMRPPKVDLQHQSSSEDFNVTLLCIVKDFYPDEIFLKWEEENQEMSFKGYDAHGMKCDHEKQTCSLLSMLEVPTSKWMMGASYRCLVAHVSSENIIDRTTNFITDSWDCTLMGAAFCDIRNESEDEYSELEEANGVWNKVFTFIILFIVAIFYGGLVTFIKPFGVQFEYSEYGESISDATT